MRCTEHQETALRCHPIAGTDKAYHNFCTLDLHRSILFAWRCVICTKTPIFVGVWATQTFFIFLRDQSMCKVIGHGIAPTCPTCIVQSSFAWGMPMGLYLAMFRQCKCAPDGWRKSWSWSWGCAAVAIETPFGLALPYTNSCAGARDHPMWAMRTLAPRWMHSCMGHCATLRWGLAGV